MKALVTGAGGFMGNYLVDFLVSKNVNVIGTTFRSTVGINEIKSKVEIKECDIRNKDKLKSIISSVKPDLIFHLAAQSYPKVSWDLPEYTIQTNVIGTLNLFESIKELKMDPIVFVACSSAEYGFVIENKLPVKENHNLLPLHPYGVSKVATDLLSYQYNNNFKIKCIRARIFNTTGPRKVNDVCSDFTKQAVMAEKGIINTIKVGNLDTKRAIMDVRDAINAFWLLTQKGKFGEVYNVSGSSAYKISDLLDLILKNTKANPKIIQDPSLMRPIDEPIIIGDSTKLIKTVGWKQEIPIEKTIKDMLEYWRNTL